MRRTIALAALVAGLAVPPAWAGPSLVYTEQYNVWVASPDGAFKQQLTSDGQQSNAYQFASADDAGRIFARQGVSWVRLAPDGSRLAARPANKCAGGAGPFWPRVDPSGTYVAFGLICGLENRVGLELVDAAANAGTLREWRTLYYPGWYGRRLVTWSAIQSDDAAAPLTGWSPSWFDVDGYSVQRVEIARSGAFLVAELQDNSGSILALFAGNPDTGVQPRCVLPAAGSQFNASISPDGTLVAWDGKGGVQVARVPDLSDPATAGQPCVLPAPPVTISPVGSDPVFTAYDYRPAPSPAPTAVPQPLVTPPPTPPATPKPALKVAFPKTITRASLKRGSKLSFTVTGPGKITARMTVTQTVARRLRLKTTLLATGRGNARAGSGSLTLRLSAAARKRASRLKGVKVTVTVAYTPAGGAALRSTGSVEIR